MLMRHIGWLAIAVLAAGCAAPARGPIAGGEMKELKICWQRLVDERGRTCDRCGATEKAVEEAVGKLRTALTALSVDVVLEKQALDPGTFAGDPLQSNRIWIGGKPIEDWLGASVGRSRCCSACGDSDCRTVTVGGTTYEDIPAELIVRAGLKAAEQALAEGPRAPCCPSAASPAKPTGCCPPGSQEKGR